MLLPPPVHCQYEFWPGDLEDFARARLLLIDVQRHQRVNFPNGIVRLKH
jgi:hypothetical protein